jgi:hypothetical protein
MFIASHLGRLEPSPESDFATAVSAPAFKCVSGACYGKNAAEQLGWDLQSAINRFASLPDQSRVAVDGWVGPATRDAARAIAMKFYNEWIAVRPVEVRDLLVDNVLTPDKLAANAPAAIQALNALADKLRLPAAKAYTIPSGAKTVTTPPASALKPLGTQGTSVWWYVLGAVVLAGAGAAGYVVYKRRKRASSTERTSYAHHAPAYA